uniref:CCHC-type domain-containing protein n=1 Tax=Caenorhabditis japonica TaxID=281687 RepID=A0A8R1E777_CAEJA
MIEKKARDAFLDGLEDTIRYNVKDKDPKTCKQALDEAIRQEILREDRLASQQYAPTVALLDEMRSFKNDWFNAQSKPRMQNNRDGSRRVEFSGKCFHCGIPGHIARDCMKRKAGLPKVVQTNDEAVRNHQIQQRPAHVKAAVTEDLQSQLEMYRQQVAEL